MPLPLQVGRTLLRSPLLRVSVSFIVVGPRIVSSNSVFTSVSLPQSVIVVRRRQANTLQSRFVERPSTYAEQCQKKLNAIHFPKYCICKTPERPSKLLLNFQIIIQRLPKERWLPKFKTILFTYNSSCLWLLAAKY